MGLLKKNKKKKPLRTTGAGTKLSALRPSQVEKLPPCTSTCPSGHNVRGWLTTIAQREKTGISLEEAKDAAWKIAVDMNPFPSIMGRVCPHPCESGCNRKDKDGAVAINSVERSIGDWGIERGLQLSRLDVGGPFDEKIAVVGAGPAGLSCAYQLARRGYKVTVFEALPESGGMLRYGIPNYRLPREIIDSEVKRITDLGAEIKYDTPIGKEITFDSLREEYDVVFAAIGAHTGRNLGCPGEEGPGVYTGTDFLRAANTGRQVDVGDKVVVIGGGDTAIDAARVSLRYTSDVAQVARRQKAEVKILYRRTRKEMPAIEREIEEALEENIEIEFLAAPAEILRDADDAVVGMKVQRMELGEPDDSGRRRPVPIEGKIDEIEVNTVITAVSQAPDCNTLGAFQDTGWLNVDDWGKTSIEGVWSGGDNANLGIATTAIGQGRKAALSIHATLRGEKPRSENGQRLITVDRIILDYYKSLPAAERAVLSVEERLARPGDEMDAGISEEQFLQETNRCFSCGLCFGCERCWMYCTPGCFHKVKEPKTGVYYTIDIGSCDGCDKCAAACPCGFLDMH
ncbi:MAG: NAD(P)-binding protein [Planctomycetota bacterium]|jgi:NADPH-dependent glutamate synthase beta subunit-like oxidoreductase/Pyruvate/2-oxoacid:ferredoxin oxidoreductase delta subunit